MQFTKIFIFNWRTPNIVFHFYIQEYDNYAEVDIKDIEFSSSDSELLKGWT